MHNSYFLKLAGAVLTVALLCQPALAQSIRGKWNCDLSVNQCMGKIRMTVKKSFSGEGVGKFELTNAESKMVLFEDFSTSKVKKLIQVDPSNGFLFFGITSKEDAETLKSEYVTFGQTIFAIFLTIVQAFPEGPEALPQDWRLRRVVVEGAAFDVSAKQSGRGAFQFKVAGGKWDVDGEWHLAKPQEVIDKSQLVGWVVLDPATPGALRPLVK